MKILMVISYFAPKWGGDVNVCENISKSLAELGHDVTILTTNYEIDENFVEATRKNGVKVTVLPSLAHLGLFIITPTLNSWLKKNINTFDILHVHHSRSFFNIFVCFHARKNSIPYIIQSHGNTLLHHDKILLKKVYDTLWGTYDLQNASNVIALTESEIKQYQFRGVSHQKICLIPNGVDLNEFKNLPKNGEFRKKFHIQTDYKIILYIGRLHGTKGLDLLIDAFYDLINRTPDTRLVIAGPDDGYLPTLLEKIQNLDLQNEIFVMGFITNEEKIQAFIDSDVFVTPCYNGFPVTFLEACACGTPIVTTKKGDVLEWIDNKVGFVVDYDKDQLCKKIQEIVTNEHLKKKFGDEGKKLIIERYNWTKIVSEFERTYEKSIEFNKGNFHHQHML